MASSRRSAKNSLIAVIRVARKNRHCPVDLFRHGDLRQAVRPGQKSKAQRDRGQRKKNWIEPIGTANDQSGMRGGAIAGIGEQRGKASARHLFAVLIERDDLAVRGQPRPDRACLFSFTLLRGAGAAFGDVTKLDRWKPQGPTAGGPELKIAVKNFPLGAALWPPDTNQNQAHEGALAGAAFARPVSAPHFLQIIELPNFGPENVDDDIARIDQNPIAVLLPLDPRGALAPLECTDQPFSDGSDVNVGAPRRDDHGVGKRGFSVQINGDDVFGFRVIKRVQDGLHHWPGLRL